MKRILALALLFLASRTFAFEANLAGKTLNEFFIISSKVFDKTIIVDPSVNGDLKLYQASGAANFRDV